MGVNCGICCKNVSSDPNLGMTKLESPKEELITSTENGNIKPNGGPKLNVSYLTEKTTTSLQVEKKDKPKIEHSHLDRLKVNEAKAKMKGRQNVPRHSAFLNRALMTIFIFGEERTGKTAFIERFCKGKFSDNYSHSDKEEIQEKKCPFNCRFYDIKITIPNKNDVFLTSVNLEQIDFYLIFYDLNDVASFEGAQKIFKEDLKSKYEKHEDNLSNVILVGNKNDLERKVTDEMIEKVSSELNVGHFEISLKDNKGITKMIQQLIESFDNDVFKFRSDNKNH